MDSDRQKMIIAVVAVVLIALGALALSRTASKSSNSATTTPTPAATAPAPTPSSATQNQVKPPPTNSDQAAASTITYSDSGFSPNPLTVKAGTTVTIKNTSSHTLQFDSNPHPQHTDDPELNVGIVASGQSKTVTVNTKGSHGYHNHLNSSDVGTLIVE